MKIIKPVALALIFAILLALTNVGTREVIATNRIQHTQKLLRQMADGGEFIRIAGGYEIRRAGELQGYIRKVVTNDGYNGDIELLVAVDLESSILNVRVTHHRETPGLGDKIDHRISHWVETFNGHTYESNFELAPEGDFDAITGATITSRAVVRATKKGFER
ncbi:MAG: RnfABCDGE type electron transport complex subunit G [Gammaproteobacteria bacterium]|jgi:RnfABCDGE-type electron transport complex G subunit|nr:RnfABCDGE type electron transport complex subunit G [Gammaproteobacteria bacterium]MBT4494326.1 RnfABCDGE type electron transport complex subunit G [Gammaproteobacteria bacterium]MBT7369791.1 RnfABCDGE type electron transport complex subunit G [Gammaproteobacteria bacterium]